MFRLVSKGVLCISCIFAGVSGAQAQDAAPPPKATPPAQPEDTSPQLSAPDPDRWWFEVEPYVWIPAVSTENEIGDIEGDTDADATDILDILKGALMLHAEAHKGSWGLFTDFIWVRVADDNDIGATGEVEIELNLSLFELGGYYRFGKKKWALDTLIGLRAAYVTDDLDITGTALGDASSDNHTAWIEPMFGARFGYQFTPKFSTVIRGDASGFGVGSELTWNASLDMRYRFTKLFALTFGYRHMFLDYEVGNTEIKLTFDGPVIGALFTF